MNQRSRFQGTKPMNSMNSMHSYNAMNKLSGSHSPFPSIFRESKSRQQQSQSQSLQNSALSFSSNLRDPFAARGNIQNLHNPNNNNNNVQYHYSPQRALKQSNSNKIMSLLKWCIDWFINEIFSGYPIYIQAIISWIIGFIAYFLYDYAIFVDTVNSYILYKAASFIGFSLSAFFLYVLYGNIINSNPDDAIKANTSSSNLMRHSQQSSSSFNNPYAASMHHQSSSSSSHHSSKRDELHFTKKSLLSNGRVSSSSFNVDSKYDFNSSPQKMASLNPSNIATQQNLNSFLAKQQHSNLHHMQQQKAPSSSMTTPMTTTSSVLGQSPIAKTFGSMGMTPAITSKHRPSLFDTPAKNAMS